jgi:hypothetical protein
MQDSDFDGTEVNDVVVVQVALDLCGVRAGHSQHCRLDAHEIEQEAIGFMDVSRGTGGTLQWSGGTDVIDMRVAVQDRADLEVVSEE